MRRTALRAGLDRSADPDEHLVVVQQRVRSRRFSGAGLGQQRRWVTVDQDRSVAANRPEGSGQFRVVLPKLRLVA